MRTLCMSETQLWWACLDGDGASAPVGIKHNAGFVLEQVAPEGIAHHQMNMTVQRDLLDALVDQGRSSATTLSESCLRLIRERL